MSDASRYKRHADILAIKIMRLQDKLYEDCHNDDLRQEIEELEDDYQYLRSRYEQCL